MARYRGSEDFSHEAQERLGVLLVNLGTPDAPTIPAVRRFLAEFLWDPRVIEVPRALWWLILHGIILNLRPPRTARAYRKIWTEEGSPLLVHSQRLASKLDESVRRVLPGPVRVALAMRYGRPSIDTVLDEFHRDGVSRLLVLPLYPQYSATTTGSVFDAVTTKYQHERWLPEQRFINQYHDETAYIEAISSSIERSWQQTGRPERLLMSFHGVPRRYLEAGDPYHCQCQKTARLIAERIALAPDQWAIAFQSRVGREEWLKPYTDELLVQWASDGLRRVDVVCPGFAVDCLETVEEIALQDRDLFLNAGGQTLNYIPALNDHEDHVTLLTDLVRRHTQGWPENSTAWDSEAASRQRTATARRAVQLGAKR